MTLADLLKENYSNLKDYTVISQLLQFVDEHDSLKDEEVLFSKRLLKVANHILQFNSALFFSTQLEKLYSFSDDAIKKSFTRLYTSKSPTQFAILTGHLYMHQGNFAWGVYKTNGHKPSWLKKGVTSFKRAEQILSSIDTPKNNEYIGWIHYHTGFILALQAEREKSVKLAKRAKRHLLKCKQYQETTNNYSLQSLIPKINQRINSLQRFNRKQTTKKERTTFFI